MMPGDSPELSRITLEKVKLMARAYLAPGMVEQLGVEVTADHMAAQLTEVLRAYLWGNKISTQEISSERYYHPDGWWQGFKESLFPDWLKRHYPVRQHEVVIERTLQVMHVCPHLDIAMKPHVAFLTPDGDPSMRLGLGPGYET